MSDSIESWQSACADAQRVADSRRIEDLNRRALRRQRAGLTLCLLAFILTLLIFGLPR